jgi:hypothetical protein
MMLNKVYMKKKIADTILKTIYSCLLGLFSVVSLSAQEIIDEDFLDHLSKNTKLVWEENDADFKISAVPDKWKNESGVVIGYREQVLFDKQKSGFLGGKADLILYEKKRLKVKLQDNSSVSDFSELYFRYADKTDGFSAFVYKNDGSKKEVALNKAVSIEDNDRVPEFFKSFFDRNISRRNEYYKVPVSDLVPGDILEFAAVTSSKFSVKGLSYYPFDPQYELCNKPLPVMMHEIVVETDNKSFITAKSQNGAPEFKQSVNGEFIVYTWTDRDRNRVKDVNFINEYMVLPVMKYQIIYTNGNEYKGLFTGSRGQIKSEFDTRETGKKAAVRYAAAGGSYVYGANTTVDAVYGSIWSKLKKMGVKDMDDAVFIKLAYYLIRHTQVYNNYYYSERQFAYLMGQLLRQQKIDADIVVTTANNLTRLNDLLFEDELSWCVRVKGKFIFTPTEHSNIYDLQENLLGNDAYKLPVNAKDDTEAVKISESTAAENVSRYELTAVLDAGLQNMEVTRTTLHTGLQKKQYSDEALRFIPYMFEDFKTYDGEDDMDALPTRFQDEYYEKRKALKEEFNRQKPDFMKKQAEQEFGGEVTYKNFEMLSDGRSVKKQDLKFKETFTVSGKTRKAGKKTLVNLPGLIGGQLQIKKDERERTFDIDVRRPRTLQWIVRLTIPAGYTLGGIENLNTMVDNETGAFKTTAKLEGNILVVDITKTYKQKNISKSKWPDMLAFVDAAYNFGHKLILLKPQ